MSLVFRQRKVGPTAAIIIVCLLVSISIVVRNELSRTSGDGLERKQTRFPIDPEDLFNPSPMRGGSRPPNPNESALAESILNALERLKSANPTSGVLDQKPIPSPTAISPDLIPSRGPLTQKQGYALGKLKAQVGNRLDWSTAEKEGTVRFLAAKHLELPNTGEPAGRSRDLQTAIRFLEKQGSLLQLDRPSKELVLVDESIDKMGRRQFRFNQVFDEIPVWETGTLVQVSPSGSVDYFSGSYFRTPFGLETDPNISEDEAESLLKTSQALAAEAYVLRKGLYVFDEFEEDARLVWSFLHHSLSDDTEYLVSAVDGSIQKKYARRCTGAAIGRGHDLQGNVQEFPVWSNPNDGFNYLVNTTGSTGFCV